MTRLSHSPTGTEILDDLSADSRMVEESLGNIARANRWLGGLAAVRHGLSRVLAGRTGAVTLVDVGTGTGDIPAMARHWARSRGSKCGPSEWSDTRSRPGWRTIRGFRRL